jgi:flagellar hook protein FlgE
MGLYDAMVSSVSGMSAQTNALTNIGQNVANVGTVGYKRVGTSFESMVNQPNWTKPAAGGVTMSTTMAIAQQGSLQTTSSPADLAVNGNGFFVVSDASGAGYLTRSGSFVPDANGNLVNSNGYYLMAYGATGQQSGNTLTGLQKVNVGPAAGPVAIAANGTLSYQQSNGATATPYHIPLATVTSPQNLVASSGNVFSLDAASGAPSVATPGSGGLGTIDAGALEQSTVDVATELSNMIVAQYDFQANSQAMKTSADAIKTLVDLNIS